jgi:glucose-6-phosphate 1-dehydrogenase
VQDLLAFRRSHQPFEDSLDAKSVGAIRVDALEPGGLEARGPYYDGAGSIRDMTQNHLLQLVAFLTMDLPKTDSAEAVQAARAKVLGKVRPFNGYVNLTIGQYRGYHDEPGVEKGSKTDTYSSLIFEVDTPRWKGVPIFVRTGKRLSHKLTAVTVEYKRDGSTLLQLDPHPTIGKGMGDYERLLLAAFDGDRSLFVSSAEVLNSWKAVDPFLKAAKRMKPVTYAQGSLGPKEPKRKTA